MGKPTILKFPITFYFEKSICLKNFHSLSYPSPYTILIYWFYSIMPRLPRVVPWTSNEEFNEVAGLLYAEPDNLDSLEQGVEIVSSC